ncbi:hypothetical protein Pyn_17818 [Prunus yedoensis var. nudiflora]|uniref:Uncharacterized protein n=1 Tax=Prunus yedoensis var. nudiflora TaxID=2094558 RepID=A0A314YE24_PRUYE|nr:hypothetical protein Pyn_17818 [Prunus yedoensis var. nudiflora]
MSTRGPHMTPTQTRQTNRPPLTADPPDLVTRALSPQKPGVGHADLLLSRWDRCHSWQERLLLSARP